MLGFFVGAVVGCTIGILVMSACAAGQDRLEERDVIIEDGNGRINATHRARVLAARRAGAREGLWV